jgi:hypothetical protein
MVERREKICPSDLIYISSGAVFLDLVYDVFNADHLEKSPTFILHTVPRKP